MGEGRVLEGEATLELGALERIEGSGGVGAECQLGTREKPVARRSVSRELGAVADHLVFEEAVVEQREPLVTVGAVDEPA